MIGTISIDLPEEIQSELEEAVREEGLPQAELIRKAIADYLFIRKFRSLRERLISKGQKDYTDEDIFEIVS